MMVLKITFFSVAIPTLLVSISVLIGIIFYKRLLAKMGKGEVNQKKYANLYPIQRQPAMGTIEFFYEMNEEKPVEIVLLDQQMNDLQLIDTRKANVGGNKVPFDTTRVPDGRYFYELRSDLQKTAKTLIIKNNA